jgi:hypothetical protein
MGKVNVFGGFLKQTSNLGLAARKITVVGATCGRPFCRKIIDWYRFLV